MERTHIKYVKPPFNLICNYTNKKAVTQEFGKDTAQYTLLPQPSIAACFEKLDSEEADYAVVPLENSTNGQVVFTYDLLRDWFMPSTDRKAPKFLVVGEQFVPIHHNVLSHALDLSQVSKIYSHPQVWGQVSAFLNSSDAVKSLSRVDTSSTAAAAELVANDKTNTSACISSSLSAELYGLPIIVPNVEDKKENTTRFLVLGKTGSLLNKEISEDKFITSIMFILNRNDPGALCEALNSFRVNDVNLTSIASRPSGRNQWEYVFFVEFEGHASDLNVKQSLLDLETSCSQVAALGLFTRNLATDFSKQKTESLD